MKYWINGGKISKGYETQLNQKIILYKNEIIPAYFSNEIEKMPNIIPIP
jgi:hypothetical protein